MPKQRYINLLIEGKTVNGFGIDHDILQASCKAYVKHMLNLQLKMLKR